MIHGEPPAFSTTDGTTSPNGDDCKVVWSLLRPENVAKLVTTYLLGEQGFSHEHKG
jgi:hypothetical protein